MFMSGPKIFGQFLKVATERERSLLFVQQMRQIWNVTQYEVASEGECFSNNLILYDNCGKLWLRLSISYA